MAEPFRVLVVDDSEDYVISLVRELLQAGYTPIFRWAYEREEISAVLEERPWDVVVADYSMPYFRAAAALDLVRKKGMDVPVVVVSADFGEDVAVAAMKAGANDFLLKGNLPRLVPALERAVREAGARRHAAEAIRLGEERLRTVLGSAPIVLWALDRQGVFTLSEGKALEALGLKPGEAVGRSVFELYRDSPQILEHSRRALAGEAVTATVELAGLVFESRYMPLRGPQGEALGVLGVAMDVTGRRRAEEALSEAETRYAHLVESIQAILWRADAKRLDFTFVSPEAEKLLGYPAQRWTGEAGFWQNHIHPADRDRVLALCREVSEESRDHQFEYRMFAADGRIVWLQDIVRVVGQKGSRELVGAMIDVTKRKLIEEELRQSQKMEAFGQLAGGVAHDFNNVLGVVIGYSDLLLEGLDPLDPRREKVEGIRKAAERAVALTRQLLAFSRKQVLQPQVLDLNAVVGDLEKMLRRLIGEDVQLVTVPESNLSRVKVDPGHMEQVVMNLAVNARDAMPEGGKLIIKTANVALDEGYARFHPGTHPGPFALLEVSDTGHGMDAHTLARIFEPFFTTKEPGKGTGLGLATVYGIVQQSGGHVSVYSEPGRGSTFKIYLPRVEPHGEPRDATEVAPARELRGSETVLVVEDEAPLRALLREILEGAGYTVLESESPEGALSMAQARGGSLHLMITDVVMPGMSGPELAARIEAITPKTRVLYISGYTSEIIAHHRLLEAGTHLLQKPFDRTALLLEVRETLDAPEE